MNDLNPSDRGARSIAESILRRDRRRVRFLVAVTLALWVLAGLLIPAFYFPLEAYVMPRFEVMEKLAERNDPQVDAAFVASHVAAAGKAAVFAASACLLIFALTSLLAAVFTILLVLTVRRVTLRQVTSGLAEISEQLRDLQRSRRPQGAS